MSTLTNKFSSYSMTQLNELLEDDEKLNIFVEEMDEMQEVQQTKERTLARNRSLAEQNLVLQPRLEHMKTQLTNHYSCLQENFEAYQLRSSTLDHNPGNGSLDTLLALLQTEGAKIEEESENMADSFLDGDFTLDAFIDEYHSKRKLAHMRRVKIEKLQEMVLRGQRLPQAPLPSSRPQEVTTRPAPLPTQASSLSSSRSSPIPQPRRAPPPPPTQPAPAVVPDPVFSYPATPYPPIPPRAGQPFPSVNPGYPHHFMSQYPPALPQRPPPRMAQ
ncbi:VPS37B subunit of ESCRT-I a [Aplochiton taeniatus]